MGEPPEPRVWHAELAWLGHIAEDVTIAVADDRIASVTADTPPPAGATRLSGLTIPGFVNPHSHALHRALRARAQGAAADFWSWRELMYRLVDRIDPDSYHALARATYAEMALAGITAVGEFHYLHHDRGGTRYGAANAMGEALIAAAAEAGIRIVLIDCCYLRAGLNGATLEPAQLRFSDRDADAWAARVDELVAAPGATIGAAIHSVRAVDPVSMVTVREWARARRAPLHVHASEQPRENEDCLAAAGLTPAGLLAREGVLGDETTVIHATHVTAGDVQLLGESRTTVCMCPTTERDLGDGVGPAAGLASAGSPIALASDMHAVIDPFEEMRAVELDQRLITGCRDLHPTERLLAAATSAGARSLGLPVGGIARGAPADFTSVRLDSPRTAGATPETALEHLVFAATAADVTDVVVDGRPIVQAGNHLRIGDVGRALADAVAAVL